MVRGYRKAMCAPVLVIWAVGNELGAGPIQITPGQNTILFRPTTQKPSVPGYITRFAPNLTYADGTVPRVDVLHLHHGVWVMRNYPTARRRHGDLRLGRARLRAALRDRGGQPRDVEDADDAVPRHLHVLLPGAPLHARRLPSGQPLTGAGRLGVTAPRRPAMRRRSTRDIFVTLRRLLPLRSGRVNDQLRRRSVGAPAARSILLTVLGEYVLPIADGVWQETLIKALEALGYKTMAARQALARSVAGGWLSTVRHGRRARVHLTDDTAEMLRAGAERIYSFGEAWEWNGRWLLVVLRVPEQRRDVRHQLRTQLAWAGFGSLGGGLWISPHVDRESEVARLSRELSDAQLLSFHGESGLLGEPEKVLAEAWDLDAVAAAYRAFIERFGRLRPGSPEAVFRAQTMLVHEWRKFPFLDPDLPASMLPAAWPRERAVELFRERHDRWNAMAQEYFRALEAVRTAA